MLQDYNACYPNSDPLNLKQYNQNIPALVTDFKDPNSDATVKLSGLVALQGQDTYKGAITASVWDALDVHTQVALITKYYTVGKERMENDFSRTREDFGLLYSELEW